MTQQNRWRSPQSWEKPSFAISQSTHGKFHLVRTSGKARHADFRACPLWLHNPIHQNTGNHRGCQNREKHQRQSDGQQLGVPPVWDTAIQTRSTWLSSFSQQWAGKFIFSPVSLKYI